VPQTTVCVLVYAMLPGRMRVGEGEIDVADEGDFLPVVLARPCAALDKEQTLTDTDWCSLASLRPLLEVGVFRCAPASTSPSRTWTPPMTSKPAPRSCSHWSIGLNLFARWSCSSSRSNLSTSGSGYGSNECASPNRTPSKQTLTNTGELLTEHLAADQALAEQLREVLDAYAVLRLPEVHHVTAGR